MTKICSNGLWGIPRNKSRHLMPILIMLLNLNGIILLQGDYNALGFAGQPTSFISIDYRKDYRLSQDGDQKLCFYKKSGNPSLNDRKIWMKVFDSKIRNLYRELGSEDRVIVETECRKFRGDILKGNLTLIAKFKEIVSPLGFNDVLRYRLPGRRKKFDSIVKFFPNGTHYIIKNEKKHIVCCKIAEADPTKKKHDQDVIVWEKRFDEDIIDIAIDLDHKDSIFIAVGGKICRGTIDSNILETLPVKNKKDIAKMQKIAYSPGSHMFAVAHGKHVSIFSQKTGMLLNSISNGKTKKIHMMAFISESELLVVENEKQIYIWDVLTNRLVKEKTIITEKGTWLFMAAAVSKDGLYLGVIIGKIDVDHENMNYQFLTKVYKTDTLEIFKEFPNRWYPLDVSISANNRLLSIVNLEKNVEIWNLQKLDSKGSGIFTDVAIPNGNDGEFDPLGETFVLTTTAGEVVRFKTTGIGEKKCD